MNNFKVRAQSSPWSKGVEFLAECDGAFGRPLTMDIPANKGMLIIPTFSLSIDAAQTLMEDLWNCGLRPTEGSGSAGAFAAQGKHLEDMRKIVFEKILDDKLVITGTNDFCKIKKGK
jgi:hypothetical protein